MFTCPSCRIDKRNDGAADQDEQTKLAVTYSLSLLRTLALALLDDLLFAGDSVWLGLTVDGEAHVSLPPRHVVKGP